MKSLKILDYVGQGHPDLSVTFGMFMKNHTLTLAFREQFFLSEKSFLIINFCKRFFTQPQMPIFQKLDPEFVPRFFFHLCLQPHEIC